MYAPWSCPALAVAICSIEFMSASIAKSVQVCDDFFKIYLVKVPSL